MGRDALRRVRSHGTGDPQVVGPAREVLASPSARDAQDILASEPAKILQIALGGASRAAALMERAADSVAKDLRQVAFDAA